MEASYNLSQCAIEEIAIKSLRFNKTPSEVLEFMIMEFSPSTAGEVSDQAKRKRRSMEDYFADKTESLELKRAWVNGYRCGWTNFQIRKRTHLFMLNE